MLCNALSCGREGSHSSMADGQLNSPASTSPSAEERLRRVFALSRDLFCIAGADGHFQDVNPAWERQFGWSLAELKTKPFLDFIHPDDQGPTVVMYDAQKAGGEAISFSNRYRRKDGTYRWLEWNATPVGSDGLIYAVARDVTEERRAEAAIRALNAELQGRVAELQAAHHDNELARAAAEERWHLLFDRNPNLMWVYDVGTLRFLAVNEAAIRHYGYTRDGFLAMTIKDIRPAEEVPRLLEDVANAGDGFEQSSGWRHRKKDGTLIDVEIRSYSLTYEGTRAKLVVIQDVSVNAVLRHLNQELEAFSYSVSHDLRAPLRHIAGFADLLHKHAAGSLDERGRRYVDTIRLAAGHMGKLIDDLLAFSRLGRAELRTTNVPLDDVLQAALADVREEIERRELALDVGALPMVQGDASLLRLVMVNLVSNALKYTRSRPQPQIAIGPLEGEAGFFVRDNGVGFDMQYAGKLFGVFQRLHSSDDFEGTGVGLANVRRIVQRHGGRAWAEGAVDRGATFFVALPGAGGNGA